MSRDFSPAQVDAVARAFHESYEMFAPAIGWDTQTKSRMSWDDVPSDNKQLMLVVVTDLLSRGIISTPVMGGRRTDGDA